MDLSRVSLTHMYLIYLGSIRGIHKSDPSVPRIELACHSSSEVSTVDLYKLLSGVSLYAWFEYVYVSVYDFICTLSAVIGNLNCPVFTW